jgi:RNA polymerase-binding protein
MRAVCRDFGCELVEEFPELARHHWRAKRLRSGSYLVGSVGGTRWTCSAPTSGSTPGLAPRFTPGLKAGHARKEPVAPTIGCTSATEGAEMEGLPAEFDRLQAASPANAPRQVAYLCTRERLVTVPFAADAEVAEVWDCRCGQPATQVAGAGPAATAP